LANPRATFSVDSAKGLLAATDATAAGSWPWYALTSVKTKRLRLPKPN